MWVISNLQAYLGASEVVSQLPCNRRCVISHAMYGVSWGPSIRGRADFAKVSKTV